MSEPKVILHDVTVEGASDHEQLLGAVERAVRTSATGDSAPSSFSLRAGIRDAVADRGGADR